MLAGTVQTTYYYTESDLKGIGSESDDFTVITPVEDIVGKTEKTTKILNTLTEFLAAQLP